MGIKNLKSLLKKFSPNSLNYLKLDKFKYSIIGIDVSIYMYKYKYSNNFIDCFIMQSMRLLKNKIIPLYVFDGKPPIEKKEIINMRYRRKDNLIKKKKSLEKLIETIKSNNLNKDYLLSNNKLSSDTNDILIDLENQYKKIVKKIIKITPDDVNVLKTILLNMGIPYIDAPGEAEIFCSYLYSNNIITGCISEDTDVIASGIKYFIRGININKNYAYVYDLNMILDDLRLTYNEFVDMCILCGCDYLPRIEGIGYITSYNIIYKYRSIEQFMKSDYIKKFKFDFNQTFLDDFNNARRLICNIDFEYNENIIVKLKKPNIKKLLNFLLKNNHNNLKTVKMLHYNLNNYYNNLKHIEVTN